MSGQHLSPALKDTENFQMACMGELGNRFAIRTRCLSVVVGQRVRLNDSAEMWDSVGVYAEGQAAGTLVVRVVIFTGRAGWWRKQTTEGAGRARMSRYATPNRLWAF